MIRIESFTPKFIPGTWEVRDEQLFFVSSRGEASGPYEHDLEQITKFLNGMYNLSEVFIALAKKGNQFSFVKMLSFLGKLADAHIMKNGSDFSILLRKLREGSVEHPPPKVELTAAYFSKERIKAHIQKTCLVPSGDSEILNKLVKSARVVNSQPGDVLISQGSEGKEFCILMAGKLGVYKEEYGKRRYVAELNPVCVFGESPAVSGRKRNAEVSALQTSWVLAVRIQDLMDPAQKEEFAELQSLRTRLIINQILSCSPLFKNVPAETLARFLNMSGAATYDKDEVVVMEGEFGDVFYVILDGHLEVSVDGEVTAELRKGEFFGEFGALSGEKRAATVKPTVSTHLLAIPSSDLMTLMCQSFYMAYNLEEEANRRRLHNTEQKHNQDVSVADYNYEVNDHSFSDYDFEDLDLSTISDAEMTGITKVRNREGSNSSIREGSDSSISIVDITGSSEED